MTDDEADRSARRSPTRTRHSLDDVLEQMGALTPPAPLFGSDDPREVFVSVDSADELSERYRTCESHQTYLELVSKHEDVLRGVGLTRIQIDDADAAFILGKRGKTKRKIRRVAQCQVNLDQNLVIALIGCEAERTKALLFIRLVVQQRLGAVKVKFDEEDCADVTVMQIPNSCVAFVTGHQGVFLRGMEEEWDTLMFFVCGKADQEGSSPLYIFGGERGRKASQLKVMAAVEQKKPGHHTDSPLERSTSDGPDTDYILIPDDSCSYVIGRDGSTKRKLAKASNCLVEYVGKWAFLWGTGEERRRAVDYLDWLIKQRTGKVRIDPGDTREDMTVVLEDRRVLQSHVAPLLRRFEDRTFTFAFIDTDTDGPDDNHKLFIFSHSARARQDMQHMVEEECHRYRRRRSSPSPRGSQPASLVHLSAHAAQRSQKNTIKDVIHEMPKNLKEVLKMTDTSPRWKQLLSEDYSKTVEHWELPTLLALLNKIPTTLQEPMFIDKNVRVESADNSASACGSTQMDVALTTDGRHVHYRRRKIGAITEHLLEAEDGSMLIIGSYSGSDESCFCHWIDGNPLSSTLADAAGAYLAECDCRSSIEARIQSGTVIGRLGRDQDDIEGEFRGKLNFHSSSKFFYNYLGRKEI
ncbi:MAG: uncharacterized protein KVP18_004445, partial [Porospora cf. gigantea A]|uniref:uncharacterized protein n=1 Tax=Porospora cf. gigantea A TaxID=2853593 RepID=UPI00355AB681